MWTTTQTSCSKMITVLELLMTHFVHKSPADPGVHFSAGLEDFKAIVGEAAELVCKLSSADCNGVWSKDGDEV